MKTERPKILIIDNDEDIVRILSTVLAKQGYRCVAAGSGEEGLRQFSPDVRLVITDLNMPGDGIRLIKSIRKTSRVPIIVASAFHRQYADRLRGLGKLTWLTKPVEFDSLLSAVELELMQAAVNA
jgi:DNA-binding response OmpR family regulator